MTEAISEQKFGKPLCVLAVTHVVILHQENIMHVADDNYQFQIQEKHCAVLSHSVISDSFQPQGL